MCRCNPLNAYKCNLVTGLLVVLASGARAADAPTEPDPDVELVRSAGIDPETPKLVEFIRARTLTPAKAERIRSLVGELGQKRFAVREKATRELAAFGPPALGPLREAKASADPEVALRVARVIAGIERASGPELPVAVLRLLESRKAAAALPAVLAYLPDAVEQGALDQALETLVAAGIAGGRAAREVVEARADPQATRRAGAGYVLGRSVDAGQRKLAVALLADADPWVRLRSALGLVAGRDRAGVEPLIDLATQPASEVKWLAEDVLRRLAGEKAPDPAADDTPAARKAYRDAWAKWWAAEAANVDLARANAEPPTLGFTVGIEWNTNRVWECGRDKKLAWEVKPDGPMDAQVLPGNRVLIAEANGRKVTERDFQGNVLWQKGIDEEPINCQRLSNGNTFIGTRNSVMEVRRDGSVVFKYAMSEAYMHAVRRLPNGHFVGVTSGGEVRELDTRGKIVRKVQVPQEGSWGDVDALPGARYLLANYGSGFLREVDATGKTLWELKIPDCCGLERLPGGTYLLGCGSRVVVVDRSGKAVWETTGQGSVRRVHRR